MKIKKRVDNMKDKQMYIIMEINYLKSNNRTIEDRNEDLFPFDWYKINDYKLMALSFDKSDTPKFSDTARDMRIDNKDFTIYYNNECPYVEYEVKELSDYAKSNNIKLNFVKIDSLEKAKNAPCIINNWANFYKGKFISNTILNANAFEKLL